MVSQLFALPLRALVIAAVLPIPSAFGAALAGQDRPLAAAMSGAVPTQSISLPAIDPFSR